jgi:adenosylcobyric acid synthase
MIGGLMARSMMIQGTSSWAGKSLLTTALARLIARRGIDVAPFKGVNMSNNARAVKGGEIGVAQYLQARAAGVEPTVQMNPVLVKPESQTSSQVVLLGRPDHAISATEWRERAPMLRAAIDESLAQLLADHDVVIAEGAGSPAEINLYDVDLANMHVAREANASVLLVADINRGGAFAHLYGTWALLEEADRTRIKGFILNRFRGDAALLAPGPKQLQELTGVPVLGVVPWLAHGLPDEDGVAAPAAPAPSGAPTVAIVRYPAASNVDEFKSLDSVAEIRWVTTPEGLEARTSWSSPDRRTSGRTWPGFAPCASIAHSPCASRPAVACWRSVAACRCLAARSSIPVGLRAATPRGSVSCRWSQRSPRTSR